MTIPSTDRVREAVDFDGEMKMSWLIVAKTLRGYVVYQEHPNFNHHDRVPRPLAVFETKQALIDWMSSKWIPDLPEHEFQCR